MKTEAEQDTGEKSDLERQFETELPRILALSEDDLEAAVAAIDRYLVQAPALGVKKSLLAWKGRLYLEHERHDAAACELQAADGLRSPDDLKNLNVKMDLAEALEKCGNLQGAHAVLITGLKEIQTPQARLKLEQRAEELLHRMQEGAVRRE